MMVSAPLLSRFLPVLTVAMLALALAGCGNSYEWNQKVTVVVETPQGERAGSSVQSVSYRKLGQSVPLEGNSSSWQVEGEAVVVELPAGRYLFALLKGETTYGDVHHVLPSVVYPTTGPRTHEALSWAAGQSAGTALPVEGRNRPLLVTFTNINDPASVRRVDPDDLAASFGPGYALKAITLEISKDPVTVGVVESVLSWFHNVERLIPSERIPRLAKDAQPIHGVGKLDFVTYDNWR